MPDAAQIALAPPPSRPVPRALPTAVVAVLAPAGTAPDLAECLRVLARSEGLAWLRLAHGALAVLVLAEAEAERAAVEDLALRYPYPLRVEVGPLPSSSFAVGRAAAWATALGLPGAPVVVLNARHPHGPDWAFAAPPAPQEDAEVVPGRGGWAARAASLLGLPRRRAAA